MTGVAGDGRAAECDAGKQGRRVQKLAKNRGKNGPCWRADARAAGPARRAPPTRSRTTLASRREQGMGLPCGAAAGGMRVRQGDENRSPCFRASRRAHGWPPSRALLGARTPRNRCTNTSDTPAPPAPLRFYTHTQPTPMCKDRHAGHPHGGGGRQCGDFEAPTGRAYLRGKSSSSERCVRALRARE